MKLRKPKKTQVLPIRFELRAPAVVKSRWVRGPPGLGAETQLWGWL